MREKLHIISKHIKEWHAFNKILLFFLCILLFMFLIKSIAYNLNYRWSISYSTPRHYNAIILKNTYIFNREKKYSHGTTKNERAWKDPFTFQPQTILKYDAPDSLEISWLSIAEGISYKGKFELPVKKIAQIFAKGYKTNTSKGVAISHYLKFVVNVAPGGTVALWLKGEDGFQREIGFYQAKKTNVAWEQFVPMGLHDRELYVSNRLKNHLTKDILNKYQTEGIPFKKWETYRQPVTWDIHIKDTPHMVFLNAYTFNGEQYRVHEKFLEINETTIHSALPNKFRMQWEEPHQIKEAFTAVCKFRESDYLTIINAFKNNHNKGSFVIEPYVEKNVKKIKLFLVTGTSKQEISLEENTVKRVLYK